MKDYTVERISYSDARPWITKKHYARRMPSVSYAFGLFKNCQLVGVLTYGLPASPAVCRGVCGINFKDIVLEYNRLCLLENNKNEASFFTAKTLKLIDKPKIVISYSDTSQNHIGYIYQASNWIYVGLSSKRTDPEIAKSKPHNRHFFIRGKRQIERPRKHRYVYFLGSKKQKKEMFKALKYPILPYPKGESKRYDTNDKPEFLKQVRL